MRFYVTTNISALVSLRDVNKISSQMPMSLDRRIPVNRTLRTVQKLDPKHLLWLAVLCYCMGLGLLAVMDTNVERPAEPTEINLAEISRVLL